jgi:hypothetical protein
LDLDKRTYIQTTNGVLSAGISNISSFVVQRNHQLMVYNVALSGLQICYILQYPVMLMSIGGIGIFFILIICGVAEDDIFLF